MLTLLIADYLTCKRPSLTQQNTSEEKSRYLEPGKYNVLYQNQLFAGIKAKNENNQ